MIHHNLKLSGGGKRTATAYAGQILLEDMMSHFELAAVADRLLPAPGSNRGYKPSVLIRQLMHLLHSGGRRLEDLRRLRRDGLFLGFPIVSADALAATLRRWGSTSGLTKLEDFHRYLLNLCLLSLQGNEPLVLDIDDTLIACGKREAKRSYNGETGFMATTAHLADYGLLVHHRLRTGNRSPGSDQPEFLDACQQQLGERKIDCLRADSASYRASVIDWCFKRDIRFIVAAGLDVAIRQKAQSIAKHQWRFVGDKAGGGVWMAETSHALQKSKKKTFRLILIRRDDKQLSLPGMMPLICAFATDLDGDIAELSAFYRQRGDHCENRIKELKRDLAAGCLPCSELAANAAWLKINGFAYNLHVAIRTTLYPFKRHTLPTLRWRCYQIAGVIIYRGRRWVLKVADVFYEQLSVQRQMLWRDLAP